MTQSTSRRFLPLLAVAALTVAVGGAAFAQSAQVDARQKAMKALGGEMRTLTGINRGQAPFDAAVTKAAFERMAEAATTAKGQFTEKGGDALPAIWENKADFDKQMDKLIADAKTGAAATDEASFKKAFADVGGDCGSCHKAYRKPQG